MPSRFTPKPVTVEEVDALRYKTGMGMMEAKAHLTDLKLKEAIPLLRENGNVKEKVEFILDHLFGQG